LPSLPSAGKGTDIGFSKAVGTWPKFSHSYLWDFAKVRQTSSNDHALPLQGGQVRSYVAINHMTFLIYWDGHFASCSRREIVEGIENADTIEMMERPFVWWKPFAVYSYLCIGLGKWGSLGYGQHCSGQKRRVSMGALVPPVRIRNVAVVRRLCH
jgi:hypothetical protein